MKKISELLGRFANLGLNQALMKKSIQESIEVRTGLQPDAYSLICRDNYVYVKGSPALRQKIFINREKIIDDLNDSGLPEKPFDIR